MAEVDIVNSALTKLGETRIVSLDESTGKADNAKARYASIRDLLLRSHTWSFARQRKKLAQSARTPAFEFDHQYPVPADFIRLIGVTGDDAGSSEPEYEMAYDATDGRVILTDWDEIWLQYIAQVTDTTRMPIDFREALAYALAADLAPRITNSNTLFQLMKEEADRSLRIAKSADGIEQYPEFIQEGTWVTVRQSGEW